VDRPAEDHQLSNEAVVSIRNLGIRNIPRSKEKEF
jgi:hypothetical protein